MKYDDASWHSGGNFPSDLPTSTGATHIGMFVAWAMLNGMAGSIHIEDFPNSLTPLKYRSENPGQWFLGACDGKFTDEDLNEDGNAFAKFYYPDSYPCDLESMFKSCETLYHVPDTWGTYDVVAPIIDKHYHAWLETRNPSKSWWKFW